MVLQSVQMLRTGERPPDFSLPCVCGGRHSLNDFSAAKALLIVFMCNHCPYVKAKIWTMKSLHEAYNKMGFELVGINSNDPLEYPEDSFPSMKEFSREHELPFHYLFDETQEVARAYGASCTPDPFLFNEEGKLAYHGRFDDALEPGKEPTTRDMAEAIEAVLEGRKPKYDFLYSAGCSIKWKK